MSRSMLMKNPLMSNLSTKVSRLKLSLSEIMTFRARSMFLVNYFCSSVVWSVVFLFARAAFGLRVAFWRVGRP